MCLRLSRNEDFTRVVFVRLLVGFRIAEGLTGGKTGRFYSSRSLVGSYFQNTSLRLGPRLCVGCQPGKTWLMEAVPVLFLPIQKYFTLPAAR
jgi:hypothetical protein